MKCNTRIPCRQVWVNILTSRKNASLPVFSLLPQRKNSHLDPGLRIILWYWAWSAQWEQCASGLAWVVFWSSVCFGMFGHIAWFLPFSPFRALNGYMEMWVLDRVCHGEISFVYFYISLILKDKSSWLNHISSKFPKEWNYTEICSHYPRN